MNQEKMNREKNGNEPCAQEQGMEGGAVLPKKIVDGICEVFAGFARMFEGISEQMEALEEALLDALDEEEPLPKPPAALKSPAGAQAKRGAAVPKPRKAPEKKVKPPVQDDTTEEATAETGDTVEAQAKSEDADGETTEEETAGEGTTEAETTEAEGVQQDEDKPASETAEAAPPWEEPGGTGRKGANLTKDDVTAVIVAKIKQNRKNNEKIGKLLAAYGVSALSDLPAEKYEAFLTDISQI